MEYVTQGIEPKKVLEYFEQLCAIPRGSKNEKAAAKFVENFAKERGLEFVRDEWNNVFVSKCASAGYENVPAVALQGHLDMVCEKNADTEHDFLNDPIELQIKDGFLRANGTTLGGDDGVAVAMMLALLDDDSVSHPKIECIFTADEEAGMSGAAGFDYSLLKAKRMINIDSEEDGSAVISSAGSQRLTVTFDREAIPAKNKFFQITIKGLMGGHSGTDINSNRASAVKLMGGLLSFLYDAEPFEIAALDGGGLDNAIARECTAVITVLDPEKVNGLVKSWENSIRPTLSKADNGFRVHTSKHKREDLMLTYKATRELISLLVLSPSGVLSMCERIPGLVESSNNIGSVKTVCEGTHIRVTLQNLIRSCADALIDDIVRRFVLLGKALDAVVACSSRNFGWSPVKDSYMQKLYLTKTKELFGKEGKLVAIHAGLECGYFATFVPGIDIISIGPDIIDIHSPKEYLDLASLERCWQLLLAMLAEK